MTYIIDADGDYTKKCETDGCPNVVLIGISRTHCIKCLEADGVEFKFKIIPYFEQRRVM